MNLTKRKIILEFYGIIRMAIGIAQLVAMCGSYFLLEFVINYSSNSHSYVFDEDILLLMAIAVIFRSIFHVLVGIGIARLKQWAKYLLIFGWPIISIITLGLISSMYQNWLVNNNINHLGEMIHWPKLFIYISLIIFDYLFVITSLNLIDKDQNFIKESGGLIEIKSLTMLFFIIVLLFSVLIFFGKPIKQGFHKGYYKSKGEKKRVDKKVTVIKKAKREMQKNVNLESLKSKEAEVNKQIIEVKKEDVSIIDNTKLHNEIKTKKIIRDKGKNNRDVPYSLLLGYGGGICIVLGLFFQFSQIRKSKTINKAFVICYVFIGVGFLDFLN